MTHQIHTAFGLRRRQNMLREWFGDDSCTGIAKVIRLIGQILETRLEPFHGRAAAADPSRRNRTLRHQARIARPSLLQHRVRYPIYVRTRGSSHAPGGKPGGPRDGRRSAAARSGLRNPAGTENEHVNRRQMRCNGCGNLRSDNSSPLTLPAISGHRAR